MCHWSLLDSELNGFAENPCKCNQFSSNKNEVFVSLMPCLQKVKGVMWQGRQVVSFWPFKKNVCPRLFYIMKQQTCTCFSLVLVFYFRMCSFCFINLYLTHTLTITTQGLLSNLNPTRFLHPWSPNFVEWMWLFFIRHVSHKECNISTFKNKEYCQEHVRSSCSQRILLL